MLPRPCEASAGPTHPLRAQLIGNPPLLILAAWSPPRCTFAMSELVVPAIATASANNTFQPVAGNLARIDVLLCTGHLQQDEYEVSLQGAVKARNCTRVMTTPTKRTLALNGG